MLICLITSILGEVPEMIRTWLVTASPVPAPDVPPRPGFFETSTLTRVLLGLAIVGVVLFVGSVLTAKRRASNPVALWLPSLLSLGLVVGGVGVGYVTYHRDEDRHNQAIDRWFARADAARPEVRDALEAAYDITIPDWEGLPVAPKSSIFMSAILPSGEKVNCYFEVRDVYVVTCEDAAPGEMNPLPFAEDK